MSVDATKWAWEQTERPSHKLVLLSLADRAGEAHECWPSITRLEADTCLDRKTIMSAIGDMELSGLITVKRVNGKGSHYWLNVVGGRENSPKTWAQPVPETVPVPKTAPVPETGLDQYRKRDRTSTENGTAPVPKTGHEPKKNLTEPKKNLLKEKIQKEKKTALGILLDFGIDGDLARDFILHRQRLRAPITETAMNGYLREADKARWKITDAVRESVERGWRGFKAEWVLNKTGSNHESNFGSHKKLSLVEQAELAEQRLIDREERERFDRQNTERAVN